MQLTELFNSSFPLSSVERITVPGDDGDEELTVKFRDDKRQLVRVSVDLMKIGDYRMASLAFSRGNEWDITGDGGSTAHTAKIFSSVINACELILKDQQYDLIGFNAEESNRAKLYQHFINRLASKMNLTETVPADMREYVKTLRKKLDLTGTVFFLFHK